MKELSGRIAVVTGGGSGMGRELVRLLVAEGCHVAMCDVSMRGMAETRRLCEAAGLPQGLRVTSHLADVSKDADVMRFRDEAAEQHATDRIHLLFNNAGIGGGGSMIVNGRDEWERTFNICWGGVYLTTRAFLPLLQAADQGAYRQHQQHERLLGLGRSRRAAHRLFGGEIRGERIHRGADDRSPAERAAHQGLGRHARAYRHRLPHQLAQGPDRQRVGRTGCPADRPGPRAARLDGQGSLGAVGRGDQGHARRTRAAFSRPMRRPARPRRRRSSWTGSRRTGGASWSDRTPS